MKGLLLSLVMVFAGDAVLAQLPPTRTRSGTRQLYFPQPAPRAAPIAPRTILYNPMPAAPNPIAHLLNPRPAQQPFNFFNYLARATPAPTTQSPVMQCATLCTALPFKRVCSTYGTTFQNDCYRLCSNEPFACEGPCPCPTPRPPPPPMMPMAPQLMMPPTPIYHTINECDFCRNPFVHEYNPVCVEDDVTLYNECEARCQGKFVRCSQSCPC